MGVRTFLEDENKIVIIEEECKWKIDGRCGNSSKWERIGKKCYKECEEYEKENRKVKKCGERRKNKKITRAAEYAVRGDGQDREIRDIEEAAIW